MKQKSLKAFGALAAFALLGATASSSFAASGNWNVDAAGNWSTVGNWSPAAVPGTTAGDTVGLNFNLTAARIVTLDTAATVGTLNIGDPTSSFFGYTLSTATGKALTLDNSSSGAQIGQTTSGGAADTISVALALGDNLTVNNVNGLTLSGIISNTPSVSTVTLTKTGAGTLTLSGTDTYVASSISVNAGMFFCAKAAANNGINGAFGNVSGGGVNIYVNSGATLSGNQNNWFGNQALADGNLPTINVTGGTVAITNNYATVGALNLTNGANIICATPGSGNYHGFQFRGTVTVGGTSGSSISGTRDIHLATPTIFDVGTTGGGGPDLSVTANFRNRSGDFGNAAASLSKVGSGVMRITSTGSSYSGGTTIAAGVLQLGDGTSANGAIPGNIVNQATLVFANPSAQTYSGVISDSGSLVKSGAGTLTLSGANTYGGSTTVSNGTVIVTTPQSISGALDMKDGATLGVTASADATYLAPSSFTIGNSAGATLQFGVFSTTTTAVTPGSIVTINGTATINISSAPYVVGASYPLLNNYSSGTLILGTQPANILGQLTVSGSTVYYQVTNVLFSVWTAAVSTNWDATTANWTNSLGGNLFVASYPALFDDSVAGAGPLLVNVTPSTVAPAQVVVNNTNKSYIIGGLAITGSGGLTKSGNNTLTLTGVHTFTGATAISAGTVEIGGAGQFGSGTYSANITDNGVLTHSSSAAQTLSGVISGSGTVVQSGAGVLTLSGNSSYNGGTTISNSAVAQANANNAFGAGTVALNSGVLAFNNASIPNAISVTAGTTNIIREAAGGSVTFSGAFSGSGYLIISNATTTLNSLFSSGSWSGFLGTLYYAGGNNSVAFQLNPSGSDLNLSSARLTGVGYKAFARVGLSDTLVGDYVFQIGELSGSPTLGSSYNGNGSTIFQVGALNTDSTFSSRIEEYQAANHVALTKVGTGTLTVATNILSFTGPLTIKNGALSISNINNVSAAGPLGNSALAVILGDTGTTGALRYTGNSASSTKPFTLTNGFGAFQVDTAGQTLSLSGQINGNGGLIKTGAGILTLSAANTYTGNTTISNGTLVLTGSGNIGASTNITVVSGATYDVSAVSYTLGGSQVLSGSGTVTGAVTTVSIGSSITPGGSGVVGALTFKNNLNLGAGASPVFDLNTSAGSGNDQVVVSGNLTLGSSDTVHVNALSGAANLDQTTDYILFSVTGTLSMTTQPLLAFDNTAPGNAAHYSIKSSGNNVVLRYSASAAPVITSVVVTNVLDGTPVALRGQSVTVYATVAPGVGTVTNVSADLSSIGGSASQALTPLGGNNYSYTLVVGPGAIVGPDVVVVVATDTTPLTGSGFATLTVNAATETWNGLGADDNWSSGNNWVSTLPPGYAGDALVFTGSTRTTPNIENNYSLAGLIFDGSASSFTIGATAGKSLTLAGGVTNSSSSAQMLTAPIVLSGAQTIEDQAGAGITLSGAISGSGLTVDMGVVTLAGANTYTGNTTIAGGTLKLANTAAIPSGSGAGNISVSASGTLDLNGTNAIVNGFSGVSGAQVSNNGGSASTVTVGANDQVGTWSGTMFDGSSALSLVKIGTNTLTLAGGNSYGGGTTISNGIVQVNVNNAIGSGAVALSGGVLAFNNASLPNAISVTAGTTNTIREAGGGTVTFSGAFSGGGYLVISNATTALNSLKSSGNWSGFTGTLFHDSGSYLAFMLDPATSDLNLSNARLTGSGYRQNARVGLVDGLAGDYTLQIGELSGSPALGSSYSGSGNTIFQVGALNTDSTFSGRIDEYQAANHVAITKVGTGTLTMAGSGAYTGPTIVSNGTLVVSTLATGGGTFTVVDGATLGVSVVSAGSLKVSALSFGNSTNSYSGLSSTVNPAITNSGALTLAGTVTVNVSGVVLNGQYPLIASASIGGTGGFITGSLPTGVTANILTNGNTIVLNVTSGTSPFMWTGLNNANWDLTTGDNWSSNSVAVVYADGQLAQFNDSSTRTNVSVAVTVSPFSMQVSNGVNHYTLSSAGGAKITGSGSLTKNGNGTLTLTNLNSDFTGGVVINGGAVEVSANTNLGSAGIALSGGALSVVQGYTNSRTLSVGPATGTGNGTLSVGSSQTFTVNNTVANYGTGTGTLIKTGGGTLQLGAANTYSGGTVVSNGTLVLATGGQAGAIRGNLTVRSGANVLSTVGNSTGWGTGTRVEQAYVSGLWETTATNDDTGWNLTYNLTGGELRANGGVSTTDTTSSRFVLGATCGVNTFASASSSIISGRINTRADGGLTSAVFNIADGAAPTDLLVSAAVTGGPGITKDGAGTMVMSGQNTYTGTTTVSSGTLLVNGSLVSAVNVNGGTFGGTGTVGGAVTVNSGGTLSPGASVGTLTINNNLTLAGNTLIELNKSLAQSNDVVNVSGTLAYGGTLTVTNLGSALVAGDSFRVFKSGGAGSLTVVGSAGSGLSFSFVDGVVSVTAGPNGPGTITNSVSGNTLSLSWSAGQGWKLQMQTNSLSSGLGTNWQYITDGTISSTNITIDPTKPTVFYRLVYP